MPRLDPGPGERRARLKPGDVCVLARGEQPYALTVPDWPWPSLASSSFHVLRPRPDRLLPDYLTWWLNTPAIAGALSKAMRGTNIRWLPRQELAALEIDPPTLARQQAVATAAALVAEESALHAELTRIRSDALSSPPGPSAAARIRLAEAQLEIVRVRLERHFVGLGL